MMMEMMMTKLDSSQIEAVRDVAVAYKAFHDSIYARDVNGIQVWGRILRKGQELLGVEVMPYTDIDMHMNWAKAAEKGKKAA